MSAPPAPPPAPPPRTSPFPPDIPAPPRRPLWRELADGSTGWVVRLLVTLALGAALAGASLIVAFGLAAVVPSWNRYYGWSPNPSVDYIYPDDELVGWLLALASIAFLGASVWIWSRPSRNRAVWRPMIWTVGIVALAVLLSVWADDQLRGDTELVVAGVLMLAGAALLVVWTAAARDLRRGRPLRNEQDGLPDVRCPSCDYRMVGLRESRCPECGTAYTLDELLAKQAFARPGGNGR